MTSLNRTSSVAIFEPLSASQRTGVTVVAVFALLSALAFVFIALRTIRVARVVFLQHDDSTSRSPEILFFRTQLGHYCGCLILSNMFISAAGLVDFSWVSLSGLSRGSACSAQAALMQIGIWGTCWFTTALGVHNLCSFVFHIRQPRWRSLTLVTFGWIIAFVAGLAPLQNSKVYGPAGSSCGITRSYPNDIFALEVLPVTLAALVSTAVYSVISIILYRELSMNSMQKARGPNSTNQRGEGEDRFEEYHRFIRTIIWSMFWFPLAFVLLLLPFCITHISMYAGHTVPIASGVFADVCVSMLGLVNVCLLCNTFRVISPVYRGPHSDKAAEAEKTFGNDASGESPIVPREKYFSQSTISLHESSHQTYNPAQPSSNHSRDPSWTSVDSNAELLVAKKASYETTQMKVATLALNGIIPSPALGRPFGGDTPLRAASFGPCSPRSFVTKGSPSEPSTQDQQRSFQPIQDTDPPRTGAKEPTFKSKAPPSLSLSPIPVLPNPFSAREVVNKSSTLAARLGIPVASACSPPLVSAGFSAQKPDQADARASAVLVTSIPRIEVNTWSPKTVDESNSQLPPSPCSSLCTDSDSEYSGEMIHVGRVRPLPEVPEPSNSEQDTVDSSPPSPRRMDAQSQRMTMTSVWSQETGYTLSQPPDAEGQEAYQRLVANLLVPGVGLGDKAGVGGVTDKQTPLDPLPRHMRARSQRTTLSSVWSQETGYTLSQFPNAEGQGTHHSAVANLLAPGMMLGDKADVGGVMSRPTPSGPRARPKRLKVASKLSAGFSQMLSPKSPNNRRPTIALAPNDSIV